MYFVYLLESTQDGGWYTGFTEDIDQRLKCHNAGKNVSTKNHRPWKLIYYEAYLNKMDALGREDFLKSGSGHRLLRKQLLRYLEEKGNSIG